MLLFVTLLPLIFHMAAAGKSPHETSSFSFSSKDGDCCPQQTKPEQSPKPKKNITNNISTNTSLLLTPRAETQDNVTIVTSPETQTYSPTNSTDGVIPSQCGQVKFLTEDFTRCFLSPSGALFDKGIYLNTTACSGHFEYHGRRGKKQRFRECEIVISLPNNLGFEFQIHAMQLNCKKGSFSVYRDALWVTNNREFSECGYYNGSAPEKITVAHSVVLVIFSMAVFSRYHSLLVTFSALSLSSMPGFEYTKLTENKAYITSPWWDGHTKYPQNMDIWWTIEIPPAHLVMSSVVSQDIYKAKFDEDCITDYFLITTNATGEATRNVRRHCGFTPPLPDLYNTSALHVHFRSGASDRKTGFKLMIYFHSPHRAPQRLSRRTWNCSVSYWQEFRDLFPCDLYANCAGAEDEEGCPYTNACPKGYFNVDGRCYLYIKMDSLTTWRAASADCQRRGTYLVSLNDEMEWKNVPKMLRRYNVRMFHIGLALAPLTVPSLYKQTMMSADGTVAYMYSFRSITGLSSYPLCSRMDFYNTRDYTPAFGRHVSTALLSSCDLYYKADYICEKPKDIKIREMIIFQKPNASFQLQRDKFVACPSGHVTHRFLSCDGQAACWLRNHESKLVCVPPISPLPPMFVCSNDIMKIPYTMVCDHRPDCNDYSDEQFCIFPACDSSLLDCGNHQCVAVSKKCDFTKDCFNGADELSCDLTKFLERFRRLMSSHSRLPPGIINFDGRGNYTTTPLDPAMKGCPETHFECPGHVFYCLPVYVRCNQINDCPGSEDEMMCESSLCPGFFRCRFSQVCLHSHHLCDGLFQCPQHEDELYCNQTCPEQCTCYAHTFFCTSAVSLQQYVELRYLEARGTQIEPAVLETNVMLIYLGLAACGLQELVLPVLKNLHSLDLSYNLLTAINSSQLLPVRQLRKLILAGNPLILYQIKGDNVFSFVNEIDMSHIRIKVFNTSSLEIFPNLRHINFSSTGIDTVLGVALRSFTKLSVVDLRGCPVVHFPRDLFHGLWNLQVIYADNYKLCCQLTLPKGFNRHNCHAPMDEVSSCESLLRSNVYRVLLVVFAFSALLCNLVSFIFRVLSRGAGNSSFTIFVTHLSVSDFLMGLYLAIIGVADRLYQGTYLWDDMVWRHSGFCRLAGFLSLLSNEMSAFIICLITLDRFLVLQFPFSQVRFHKTSSHLTCAALWLMCSIIAAVPLFPVTAHWDYYSQTGICIPLPITRKQFAGQKYSFTIMIVLNFLLFLLIAVGQCIIYWSIRSNSITSTDSKKKSKDQTIARRLITIATSDFLCWFPIGLLGLLANSDYAIPSEFNVAIAIIVMPLNSSLNPFLYTLNVILDRRQREKEDRLYKRLMAQVQQKAVATPLAN